MTLARAQRGDAAAFQVLVETYQDRVFALVWRMLGRRAGAALVEDVAQETFLAVYRALPRFVPEGPALLSTWILTIAGRTALKARRGPAWLGETEARVAELPARERTDGPAEDHAFAQALAAALDRLPAGHRAAFVLREYHDFDYGEIARALGVDLGTVKSRLSRARRQLREELKEFEP